MKNKYRKNLKKLSRSQEEEIEGAIIINVKLIHHIKHPFARDFSKEIIKELVDRL